MVNQNSPAQTFLDDAFEAFRKTAAEFDAAKKRGEIVPRRFVVNKTQAHYALKCVVNMELEVNVYG